MMGLRDRSGVVELILGQPSSSGIGGPPARQRFALAMVGVLLAGMFFSVAALDIKANGTPPQPTYIKGFENERSVLETMFRRSGDGQAYAELARHPSIEPERFVAGGRKEAAYRASHPLWSWLGWAASLGRYAWVLPALLALSIASAGLLVWILAGLMPNHPERALLGVLLPGSLAALTWLLPEPLGLSFTLLGLFSGGVGWFVVAGLVRESFLIVPAVLFLKTRNLKFLIPGVAWLAWQINVWINVGVAPTSINKDGFDFGLPFVGIARAMPQWGAAEIVALVLLIAASAAAYRRYRAFVLAHLAFAVCVGWEPWNVWRGITRLMITVYALGLISLDDLPRRSPQRRLGDDGYLADRALVHNGDRIAGA